MHQVYTHPSDLSDKQLSSVFYSAWLPKHMKFDI